MCTFTSCAGCADKGASKWLLVVGRVLLALIFIIAGFGKIMGFSGTVAMVAAAGFPFATLTTILAIIFEFGGGVMLLLGFHARTAAAMLSVFTVLTIVGFHMNWADQVNMAMALKNLAIIGGLFQIIAYGAGPMALARSWKCPASKVCIDCRAEECECVKK